MSNLEFTLRDCDDVVKHYFPNEFKTIDFEIIPRDGENFIFIITIEHKEDEETFYFYAKPGSIIPRTDEVLRDFKIEKITPKFLCAKAGLLFFEDLNCEKFYGESNLFKVKHIRHVLKILARFHAASFGYEEQSKCKLKEKYDLEEFNLSVKEEEDLIWASLGNREKINEVIEDLERRQLSPKFRKVLCHSNLKGANILFLYENGIPDDCKLINFKNKLYAPPVYDVLQVIFFNTNEDFRREYFESSLLHYHNELKASGVDIDKILPIEELRQSSHFLLPLIKLETVIFFKQDPTKKTLLNQATNELKEILTFPRLTKEDCYVITKNKIESNDYKLLSFKAVSQRFEIKIHRYQNEEIFNFLLKFDPSRIEMFVFDTLVPQFEQFSLRINDCLPNCCFRRSEDLIVFEDLSSLNYQFLSNCDSQVLPIVVKKLATLHATGLAFEEKMSEKLKKTYRLDEDYGDYFSDASERFRNVLCLGNVQTSGILIQLEDSKAVDCKFFDCGSVKYCPPAVDFLSVLRLTESKNDEELKQTYYNELGRSLSSYNYKVGNFLSYHEFVDSIEFVQNM